MNSLEELRRRRAESYKKQLNRQLKIQQQVEMLENAIRQKLTKEAVERYGNLKAAHPEKAIQLLAVLAQLEQHDRIDDSMLKDVLTQMSPEKRETRIRRI